MKMEMCELKIQCGEMKEHVNELKLEVGELNHLLGRKTRLVWPRKTRLLGVDATWLPLLLL